MTLHRDDLIRMVDIPTSDLEFRAETNGGATLGTLEGYAAVFNSDTLIDSWEGRFIERMSPGAFKRTLQHRGDRVKVLFNHGFDPSIGDKPLGKPRVMEERDEGLWVEVPLDDTTYNRDLVASLRSGALDGMSIRFSVADEDVDEDEEPPVRTIREAKLYEFGPVTFPAYEATTAGVRGREAYQAWRTAHPLERANGDLSIPDEEGVERGTELFVSDLDEVTSEASDSPPEEAPVSEERNDSPPTEEAPVPAQEPELPVRRVNEDAIRDKASSYLERLEKIMEKHG